jgi:hypothetical protein
MVEAPFSVPETIKTLLVALEGMSVTPLVTGLLAKTLAGSGRLARLFAARREGRLFSGMLKITLTKGAICPC